MAQILQLMAVNQSAGRGRVVGGGRGGGVRKMRRRDVEGGRKREYEMGTGMGKERRWEPAKSTAE